MSRNYELLVQTGTTEVFGLPHIQADTSPQAVTPYVNGHVPLNEVGALVHRLFQVTKPAPRTVVFCDVEPISGSRTTVARVAETLTKQLGGSVCLVDANPEAPSIHDYFGYDNAFGLTDVLEVGRGLEDAVRPIGDSGVSVITSGSMRDNWSSLLASADAATRLKSLRSSFDYIAVYGPPLALHSHGCLLAEQMDGLVMLIEAHATRRDIASKITASVTESKARLLGVVLNNRRSSLPASLDRRLP